MSCGRSSRSTMLIAVVRMLLSKSVCTRAFAAQAALNESMGVGVGAGLLDTAELRHMLMSVPAMNYYSNADGTDVSDEEELDSSAAEQLASTVEQLLKDHDSDAGAPLMPPRIEFFRVTLIAAVSLPVCTLAQTEQ